MLPSALLAPLVALVALAAALAGASPLDDYVNKPDPNFAWFDTNETVKTLLGGTGHVLNVTSQQWLDTSRAAGPDGDIWTHQAIVIVPKEVKIRNMSLAYLTGDCNEHVSVPGPKDEEILVADVISASIGVVVIVVYQIPNCPIVYPSDPSQKRRTEDAVIAWGFHEYLLDQDPEWLPLLPMAKGAMQCMRAAEEYTKQQGFADIEGWLVSGASKRGWTTWMVGSVDCPSCPNIVAIAPLVPILPSLQKDLHRMWRSYGGWTFAFADYLDVNLTTHVDDPIFDKLIDTIDPISYYDRLARLPKFVVLSSDDEFMMMDWSDIWYDELSKHGETHMLIIPNSEHSLATGIPELLPAINNFAASIAHGVTKRPSFTHKYDEATGTVSVTIDKDSVAPTKVVAHTAKTLQGERRDFRWVRLANEQTGNCTLPDIPLSKPVFGGNCIQPILWKNHTLTATAPGQYSFTPTEVKDRWVGYYIEVFFPSDTNLKRDFQFSTPGYVWPNTLPFEDCTLESCAGHLL